MGLTRKKITVRTKRGKSFQRSVMVRAEAIGKRTGGKKLNSLNPWQTHHVENVKTRFPQSSGSSGPGSSHSFLAHLVGAVRDKSKPHYEREGEYLTKSASAGRQQWGQVAVSHAWGTMHIEGHQGAMRGLHIRDREDRTLELRNNLIDRYGRSNVHEVYQDPRRHVRGFRDGSEE